MKQPPLVILAAACLIVTAAFLAHAEEPQPIDKGLAADLKLLQGSWELVPGDQDKDLLTIRSVKTIEGNTETLRRYNIETNTLTGEHSVEFKLTKSGNVHVFTFYGVGGTPERGMSYVYKVDEENFWDIPGLLRGDDYQNYLPKPTLWHWKRVVEDDSASMSPATEE